MKRNGAEVSSVRRMFEFNEWQVYQKQSRSSLMQFAIEYHQTPKIHPEVAFLPSLYRLPHR